MVQLTEMRVVKAFAARPEERELVVTVEVEQTAADTPEGMARGMPRVVVKLCAGGVGLVLSPGEALYFSDTLGKVLQVAAGVRTQG